MIHVGKILDYDYRATARKESIAVNNVAGDDIRHFPIERARTRSLWYFIFIGMFSTISFGWTIQARSHISAPLVLVFICGVANTGVFNVCSIFLLARTVFSHQTAGSKWVCVDGEPGPDTGT
jgi:hypothetical protein